MTVKEFLANKGNVTSIYTGQEEGCRCGCKGTYFEPGEKGFTRALNRVNRKLADTLVVIADHNRVPAVKNFTDCGEIVAFYNGTENCPFLDIVLSDKYPFKTITLYFD